MSPASTLSLSLALVVAYVAAFHAWIALLRRKDRENLWFALAAGAIAVFGFSAAMLYDSRTVEEGLLWQQAMLATSVPLVLGFFRFTCSFLGVERPWATRAALALALVNNGLAWATPWVFTGEASLRHVDAIGLAWTESHIHPVGHAIMASYFLAFAYLIFLYARNLHVSPGEVRTLLVTVCIWCGAGLSDAAVSVGLYEAPYLLAFGYLAIVLGISSILIRRFVRSMDEIEHLNATLHERVEARSAELRQKELQLAHGERLATIGTLAASVAHEINNPIAFVHSNLNRLEEIWDKAEASEDVTEILEECREGTERVRLIVSDLLSLSRRGDRGPVAVDLHEVISSTLPVVRKYARERAHLAVDLRGVPKVRGDVLLLSQVVLNLVMNALQALPQGSANRNRVSVSTSFEDGAVWLRVADNGPGIPLEVRERMFDPFYTTKSEGTGLGLAVTHQIVERHGGDLHVESDGSGTSMAVRFPPEVLATDPGGPA
jgi:signal transduction histidine kinase